MKKITQILILVVCCNSFANGQILLRDAMNSFALYFKSKDFAQLEKAKKSIDDAYKTARDSNYYRANLLRCMIYSTLANADKDRKLKYVKDPLNEGMFSLARLTIPKYNQQHIYQINYCKKQLANAWLTKANTDLADNRYSQAYDDYLWSDSLSGGNINVKSNLAVLSERLGYTSKAIYYYNAYINSGKDVPADYYLALANLYEQQSDLNNCVKILKRGAEKYPKNKDLLFKQVNLFSAGKDYNALVLIIDDAINLEPDNIDLYYMAGYAYEMLGKSSLAETYYKKILTIEPYNYEAHYALGLLNLEAYLKNNSRKEALENAANYLTEASEINPNSVNVLKSLVILYKNTGDADKLRQIESKLNQVILN
ncbi:hypothetical protein FW774_06745 [Pedobacter sp. BS3]|uniref:tetratricopeptide repeat protein n=1 Tax=Pedobacter sp. BS3 TaxID=2567937 RepID=UPI0011EED250|nr:hypothetical protein [Pedobacter sp. BS3]TZF84674.1 hypothetical protein FW774_06745 [Pedobacter sp. BS3]